MIGTLPRAVLEASSDSCDDINQCRQLSGIIWGCLVTIFVATWVSVHPNIPAPSQGWFKPTLRRLGMMLVAVIAPELIVFFAARQLHSGRTGIFQRCVDYLEFGVSITHGFFFSMGGFVSRNGHHPITSMSQINDPLLRPQYLSDIEDVEEEDMMDKSKSDALAKGIALLQGLWFITQIIARFAQRLPTSELEIATFAFAVVNIFTWVIWWYKPLDVRRPILIGPAPPKPARAPGVAKQTPASPSKSRVRMTTLDCGPSLTSLVHENNMQLAIPLLAGPRDYYNPHAPNTANIMPRSVETNRLSRWYEIIETFLSGPILGTYEHYRPGASTFVPEFWSSSDTPRFSPFAAMLVGTIFGLIHCTAWNAAFPSVVEMWMWRVSAVLVAAYPASLLFPHLAGEIGLCPGHVHEHVPVPVQVIGVGLYVVARLLLTVLAGTTLRTMDPGWFKNVDLTVQIAHIGISL
ncbi:hypothetical protein B0H11DRAFT_1858968 [Mycena galericulata]|nr:hypothetical protein B0H11DRAFT_1858968 [Mycena galericulata]